MAGNTGQKRHRQALFGAAAIVLIGLGLYQSGYTSVEWEQIKQTAETSDQSVVDVIEQSEGTLGLGRLIWMTHSDERLYSEYARLLLDGTADIDYISSKQYAEVRAPDRPPPWRPYRDVRVEYLPGAVLGMVLPGLVSLDPWPYRFLLGVLNIALLIGCLAASRGFIRPSVTSATGLVRSALLLLLLGIIVVTRMDLLATSFLLAAMLFCQRGRDGIGGMLTGLGIMTKLFPGVWALLYGLYLLRNKELNKLFYFGGFLVATLVAVNFFMWQYAGSGYLDTFAYHSERGIQIESTWASVLLSLQVVFDIGVALDLSYGSSNLTTPIDGVIQVAWPLLFVGLSMPFLVAVVKRRGVDCLKFAVAGVILAFILSSKVLSPQYLLWVFPFLLYDGAPKARRRAIVFLLACAVSQVIYPRGYDALKAFEPIMILALLLRNGLLFWLWWSLVQGVFRRGVET